MVKLVMRDYVHFKLLEYCGLDVKCPLKWSYLWTLDGGAV